LIFISDFGCSISDLFFLIIMSRPYPIPQTVQPRSWDHIEQYYIRLNEGGIKQDNFLELIRYIRSSGISIRLFACTSLDKLVISIYNPIEWERETLHIEFDRSSQKWHFKYYPKPFEKVEFERTYPADKGIEKLDAFIKLMRW